MALLTKLRSTLNERQLLNRGDTLVVGVSGGPDSLALLHALRALAPELALKLHVAHLNHQLRGADADADEQFVLWLAREWGLPVASASWDVRSYAEENRLSLEEAARMLRYQFLVGVASQLRANAIAVAHNADDQVETVLLHLLRGAGLAGLRGMEFKSNITSGTSSIPLIRPLLDVTRAEVEEYCAENDLQPREDETNADTTILRNRLRHQVIPYLETINPNLREVLRHTALAISDDYAYIHQNVLGIFDRMTRSVGDASSPSGYVFDRKWFRALPVNLQRGVLREAVSRLRRLKNIGYPHIENARRVAVENDAGAEATLPQGLTLVVGYDDFTVGEQLPIPDEPLLLHAQEIGLNVGGEVLLEGSDWGVRVQQGNREIGKQGNEGKGVGRWQARFNADEIRGQLVLRTRCAGERFAPQGMGGKHKSLHEFMIDEKIPRHLREFVPILADEEKVLWVVGYRASEPANVKRETSSAEPQASNVIDVEFFKG